MASYELQIRLQGYVNRHKPYCAVTTACYAARRNARVWGAATLRAGQTSRSMPYATVTTSAWTAPYVYKTSPYVTGAATFRSAQSAFWQPMVVAHTVAHQQTQAQAVHERLCRPVVNIVNDIQRATVDVRVAGTVAMPIKYQSPTEVYVDPDVTETADTLKPIVWWGGAYDSDYVYIEYAGTDGGWHDILESQTWVVASGAMVQPTFVWQPAEEPDEQAVTYEVVVAFDFGLERVAYYHDSIPGTITSHTTGALETDQTYFWAVRARDAAGDCSAWSTPRAFHTYRYMPPDVKPVGGVNRLVVPYRNYKYDWFVGNLPNGTYNYAVHRVGYDGTGALVYKEPVVQRNTRRFIVNHDGDNPPEILNIYYDPQAYKLKFDVRLQDSRFRLYDIKSVSFADQRDKVTADASVYYIDSYTWRSIPLVEIAGKHKDLTSNPYLSRTATLSWAYNGTMTEDKDYTFDVRVMADAEAREQPFRWGWRAYTGSEPGVWTIQTFDNAARHYQKPYGMHVDAKNYAAPYYGKANPTGIVMNRTYFDWHAQRGHGVRWDFAVFPMDSDEPLILKPDLYQPYAVITPQEFYDAGVTNVLLDLTGISDTHYELRTQEIDKIVAALHNRDFYWQVRAADGLDVSSWSAPERSRDFNIHHFEWDVRNRLEDFKSTNFLVLKVEIQPSVAPRMFEYPYFRWLNISNPLIEQYASQIDALAQRRAEVQPYLYPYYDAYIAYLKSQITSVRNYVLDGLIAAGYFADATAIQNFVSTNLHSGPVSVESDIYGATYTSELDIHQAYLDCTKDLHRLNPFTGAYDWSPVFYTWRMDRQGYGFASQKGKPMRAYDLAGMACENSAYTGCYLSTGTELTCPWFGRKDLGFCNGFVTKLRVCGMRDATITIPGVTSPMPDPDVDPQGFVDWLAMYSNNNQSLGEVLSAAAADPDNLVVEEIGFGFDPGACPMAVGADRNSAYGGPCARYKRIDHNYHQRYCDVCGSERQPQFLGAERDLTPNYTADVYTDLNPAGFAGVEIRHGEQQLAAWSPLVLAGQSRQPQQRFTGLKLNKSQLPGEHNADHFDSADHGIGNAFFKSPLGNFIQLTPAPPAGTLRSNWYTGATGVAQVERV